MSFESFPVQNTGGENEQVLPEEGVKSENKDSDIDFENFLEREVFPSLGLGADEERKYLESVEHQENKALMDRVDGVSFQNARDSARMFLEHYCQRGIFNEKKKIEEEAVLETQSWDEFWSSEGGRVDAQGERVDREGRPLKDWRNAQMIRGRLRQAAGKTERVIFDKNEVSVRLREEFQKLISNSTLTYNVDGEAIERILESGKILPMTEQPEEEKAAARKTGGLLGVIGGAKNLDYDDRRKQSEQIMGTYTDTGPRPVYAALAGGSDGSLEKGAAPQYGEIVLVFDDSRLKDRVIFTEGDSMNPMGMIDALRRKESLSDRYGLEHRLLNRGGALVAKAIYNLSRELEEPYYGKGDELIGDKSVQYIEASVLGGVDMSYVKEIVVNLPEGEFGMEGFKKDYPQYAHLIRFSKSESGVVE